MKTVNVYGEANLSGNYNIICPCCNKRMIPVTYSHNNLIDNKPSCYQLMQGIDGSVGVFVICSSCNEMFFAYTPLFNGNDSQVIGDNPNICGSAGMFIQSNIDPNGDVMTEVESIFAKKQMDITVYRPYVYKQEFFNQRSSIILYNNMDQVICSIFGINVEKFIRDNMKILKSC